MVKKGNLKIEDKEFYYVEVKLPKTTLLVVGNDIGYFMCAALDVSVFEQPHLIERKVVCGRASGVKTIEQLLDGKLYEISTEARNLGVTEGMLVRDALLVISK